MPQRQSIELAGQAHNAPIPNGCKIGNMVFSSGITGRNPQTGSAPAEADAEARQLFNNVRAFMEAAGGGPEHIGHVTVYLRDEGERESINKAWVDMFPDEHSRPARHALEAPIRGNFRFQVEIVAVLPANPA